MSNIELYKELSNIVAENIECWKNTPYYNMFRLRQIEAEQLKIQPDNKSLAENFNNTQSILRKELKLNVMINNRKRAFSEETELAIEEAEKSGEKLLEYIERQKEYLGR